MRFPDAKLVMPKQHFEKNDKVIYTDAEGNTYNGKVIDVIFKSLITGYKCLVELETEYKGLNKILVSDTKLSHAELENKPKKSRKNKIQK